MFKAAPVNPYDELVIKATHEDLLSEDWDTNLTICDKVQAEGDVGAKNVITALLKRLVHRNPNVQIFALELANSLYQNCGKLLHLELSSRAWTGAMERLITDRTTVPQVKTKAAGYVQTWWNGLKGGESEGVLGDLIESLKTKNVPLEAPVKRVSEDEATKRAREEEAELQRVLELSKQDQGGRNRPVQAVGANASSASGSGAGPSSSSQPMPSHSGATRQPYPQLAQVSNEPRPFPAREPTPPPMPTRATASRVRAIYPFVTHEKGELSFEKGDVIKVIDRMYDEWYTGAVGGRIGIFPVSYVEPLADPTTMELQREAQEEAKIFAAQGMIVNLQRMLDGLDPMRGDRLDDPELESMYQKVVELQPQIVSLMKKYADQRAELEHIHMGFVKASRQYAVMTQPQQATHDPHYGQGIPPQQRQTSHGSQQAGQPYAVDDLAAQQQAEHAAAWNAYYAQLAQHQQAMAAQGGHASNGQPQPGQHQIQPQTQPDQQQQQQQQQYEHQRYQQQVDTNQQDHSAGEQSQAEREKIAAAWQAYYAAQAQAQAQAQAHMQASQSGGGGGVPAAHMPQSAPVAQAPAQPFQAQAPASPFYQQHDQNASSSYMQADNQRVTSGSTTNLPLSGSPEPSAQPLLAGAAFTGGVHQMNDGRAARNDSLPNPYSPVESGLSAPAFSAPQQHHIHGSNPGQPFETPPPVAPKPNGQNSQDHVNSASQPSVPFPPSSGPGYEHPSQVQHSGAAPPFQHASSNPYLHPDSHQVHHSQSSVGQYPQGGPLPPAPAHGLERAMNNLSVGSAPQAPPEARFT